MLEVEILRSTDLALVRELSLVLKSTGVPHRVVGNQHQQWIVTPEPVARAALSQLTDYQRENLGRSARREPRLVPHAGSWTQALVWCVALALVNVLAQAGALGVDWRRAGAMHGERLLAGEVWRPVTALTLHADIEHLVGNLAFGALFLVLLHQVLGWRLAWALTLAGGLLGNVLNALLTGPELRSLGASTAVFAALGSLTAVQFSRKAQTQGARARRWIPVVTGVLLLGWNGMGRTSHDPWLGVQRAADDDTDVGAHVAGFAAGAGLGLLAWRLRSTGRLGARGERVLGRLVPVVTLAAWVAALAAA